MDTPEKETDSVSGIADNSAGTDSWRGPLHVHCPTCGDFKRANSLRIPASLDNGGRRFHYTDEPDIAWFRRKRRCVVCKEEFLTGEVNEALLEELRRLRQGEARRRAAAYSKASHDLRARHKWLDTTGDDVPYDLAAKLVGESAWWLTHSSGAPVRAPRHADRLQKLYCGWSVEFGANWFAAGRALARAREYAKSAITLASQGKLPEMRELRRRMRTIPSGCVLNINRDFYDHYHENSGWLVFGAQAIDVDDCERILMRVTGLNELITECAKIQTKE